MRAGLRNWRWIAAGLALSASLGCSFVIDLEGPRFAEVPEPKDLSVDPPAADGMDVDGAIADAGLAPDAVVAPADLTPLLPEMDLTLSSAAPVVVHSPTGQVRLRLDQSDAFRVRVLDSEAVTARFGDASLVTLMGLTAGRSARIGRPLRTTRTATMRVLLPSPYPEATGYVMTNGCRHLSCVGEECETWFEGALSLSVTNACALDEQVRTLAIATRGGQPIGWAQARDPFPESGNAAPEFEDWNDGFFETLVHATGVEMPRVHALPWTQFAFGTDIAPRRTDAGRLEVQVPDGFSPITVFGLDVNPLSGGALGRAQQGMRLWRRADVQLPVVLEAQRLPPTPQVAIEPDAEGHRPTIRWTFDPEVEVPKGLARVEFSWDTEEETVEWILFTKAAAGRLRLPHLPEGWARARPPVGASGRAAQVTIVQCRGNDSLSEHYADPCPLYGAAPREGRLDDLRWSAGFQEAE